MICYPTLHASFSLAFFISIVLGVLGFCLGEKNAALGIFMSAERRKARLVILRFALLLRCVGSFYAPISSSQDISSLSLAALELALGNDNKHDQGTGPG
jgi:hypothetical protein